MTRKNKHNPRIKILITGCSGFVGLNLTRLLKKKKKYQLFCSPKNLDLSKQKNFFDLILNCQPHIIIHLASRTVSRIRSKIEDKLQHKNTYLPIKNLVDNSNYCKNLKKIIFCGSIEEYGNIPLPYREKDKPKPATSYGFAKYSAYKYLIHKSKKKNLNFVWLRPSLMFGQNDNVNRFLGSILFNLKQNKEVEINLGSQKRDFLYVEDFCKFIFYHIKFYKKFNYKLINVTSGNWFYLRDLLKILKKQIPKKKFKLIRVNNVDDKSIKLNSSNLFKKFHTNFKFTPFKKSLKITLNSYGI
jgi:nucleoside-diphosphate-sugar epimerase